jgi:L-ascorbate metabolism protein UlaG (beta-lactamase superfamily)
MKLLFTALAACCVWAGLSPVPASGQSQTFETAAGPVKITPIIHASTLIEAGGKVIYVDPARLPSTDGLPPADFIIISDIHGDHMDPKALAALSKSSTLIWALPAALETVKNAVPIANGETKTWDKWTIEAIPMYNMVRGPEPGKFYHDKGRGNGYVMTYGGKRFYFSGDTEGIPEMRALKNIDVAFICMNLPNTMAPAEAADAVKAFHPKIAIPYHYRSQSLGAQDLTIFKKALEGTGIEVRLLDWYPATPKAAIYPLEFPEKSQISMDGTALVLEDYANVPLSSLRGDGPYPSPIDFHEVLARPNTLVSEPPNAPGSATRFFVNDLNGVLYILDKNTRKFIPYIAFPEVFPRMDTERFASGIVTVIFDPDYAHNGKFYTVHTEVPTRASSAMPINAKLPTLNLTGYATTPTVNPPAGDPTNESVLVEWTDKNIKNSTFEGTAREILRVSFSFDVHQMGDLLFNPLAKPGDADYGNLYISMGDGGGGETPGITHTFPQQLNALQGKILRITPDVKLRPADMMGANGRYRIPSTGADPNPFLSTPGARPEIIAYGFRNPHRMYWDAPTNTLLVNDIGLHSWEEVNIITKGGNYGWAEREGNEFLIVARSDKTGSQLDPKLPFPDPDVLTVAGIDKPVTPIYPVALYSHREGDAMGSGFVYRGKLMPQMVGKYLFTDISTGRMFYTDLQEMIATQRVRGKQAPVHEIQIMYKSPYDASVRSPVKRRMYDIVADAFKHKDGIPNPNTVLPEGSRTTGGYRGKIFMPAKADPYGAMYGGGRADVRLSLGGDGEIYVLSKSDGMIRKLSGVATPPPAASSQTASR